MINHICFTSRTEYIQRRSLAILKLKNNSNISHTCCRKKESTCKLKSANSSEQLRKLRLPRIAPIQSRWRMCMGIKRNNIPHNTTYLTLQRNESLNKKTMPSRRGKLIDEAIFGLICYPHSICRLWFTAPSVDSTRGRHLLLLRTTLSLGRGLWAFIFGNNFHPVERCLRSFRDHHCESPCYLWFKVQPLPCPCHRRFSCDWGTIHSVRYTGCPIKKWPLEFLFHLPLPLPAPGFAAGERHEQKMKRN